MTKPLILFFAAALLAVPAMRGHAQQSAPVDQESYLFGEVRTLTPDNRLLTTTLSLVRRVLKPSENRIVEIVETIEAGKPVREFTTVFEIAGAKFTIKDQEGTFSGHGELVGKPWEWTGWNYEVEMLGPRKGRLKGEDVLGPTGLSVRKSFITPDGTTRALFTEELRPIGKAAYDILRGKLVPEQK
ncbi:MAG: hypothetical protein ABIS68_07700 [Casimicrobiaceae bacterium]